MKKYFPKIIATVLLILSNNVHAACKLVYTIGAYDEPFAKRAEISKLGPLLASDIPAVLPKSFLENDGSYGGGEAFCTIRQACIMLKQQLASGILPPTESWHIYLLDASWEKDIYELHPKDFRIKHNVKVIKLIQKNC